MRRTSECHGIVLPGLNSSEICGIKFQANFLLQTE
jgi:hypothetical protein